MDAVVDLVGILVWPLLIAGLAFWLREPIKSLAAKVTHVRIAGQDVFIARALDTTGILLKSGSQTWATPESLPRAVEERVMGLTASDPVAALAALDLELERSMRAVALAGGWLGTIESADARTLWQQLFVIREAAEWGPDVLETMLLFSHIKGAIEADADQFANHDVIRTVKLGLTIVGMVNAVPREHFLVVATDVPVFEDRELTIATENRAVLVRLFHDSGQAASPDYMAYWTSTPKAFTPGTFRGYEWRHPDKEGKGLGWTANVVDPEGKPVDVAGGVWDFKGRDITDMVREIRPAVAALAEAYVPGRPGSPGAS